MTATQLRRIQGTGGVESVGGSARADLIDALAGFGSMDLLALNVDVQEKHRARAMDLVQAIISVRSREADLAIKHLAD
jgi:hypothetical protein